jgi:hypothetical protein
MLPFFGSCIIHILNTGCFQKMKKNPVPNGFIYLPCPKILCNLSRSSLLAVTDSTLEGSMPNAEQNGTIDF